MIGALKQPEAATRAGDVARGYGSVSVLCFERKR